MNPVFLIPFVAQYGFPGQISPWILKEKNGGHTQTSFFFLPILLFFILFFTRDDVTRRMEGSTLECSERLTYAKIIARSGQDG